MLRVDIATGPDWADVPGWDELLRQDPGATPFQTREWATTWWRHYGVRKRPFAMRAWEGDDLVGLYPLYSTQGVWRTIRPMGVGPADYLKPLAIPGMQMAVLDAFLERLAGEDALVDLHQLPLEAPPEGAIEQATCLVLDLPGEYDAFLGTLSKSLRYDARRFERDPKLRVVQDAPVGEALAILFEQHERRWRSRGLPGSFVGRARRFHEEWATLAERNRWLRLDVLEYDDRPVGAIYAMTMSGTAYYYQGGFDPQASSISPGSLLVAHAIRRAISEGVSGFDFCRGDEPYKRRWKPQRAVTNYRILMAGSGLGRVGRRWNRMAWELEVRVRRRLEGGRLFPARKPAPKAEPS